MPPSPWKWSPIIEDDLGPRRERVCPACGRNAFRVVQEKERIKKHPGPRANRIVVICANPKCKKRNDEGSPSRVGWPVRRRTEASKKKAKRDPKA